MCVCVCVCVCDGVHVRDSLIVVDERWRLGGAHGHAPDRELSPALSASEDVLGLAAFTLHVTKPLYKTGGFFARKPNYAHQFFDARGALAFENTRSENHCVRNQRGGERFFGCEWLVIGVLWL